MGVVILSTTRGIMTDRGARLEGMAEKFCVNIGMFSSQVFCSGMNLDIGPRVYGNSEAQY